MNLSPSRHSHSPGASFTGVLLVGLLCLGALPSPAQSVSSGLSREFYSGIPGNALADLLSAPNFPHQPTFRDVLTVAFETGPNEGDNYGQRIRAFLQPPESGLYTFWIASDDASLLYLSPDDDPSKKVPLAAVGGATGFRNWTSEPGQQSAPIQLEAGRDYYVEVLMKEGVGGDHVSVRWQRPSGAFEGPIPATYFLPFETALRPPVILQQPASVAVPERESAQFTVVVGHPESATFRWQRNGTAISGTAGASAVLNLPNVQVSDHGARFRNLVANSLGVLLSNEAILSVIPDTTPPTLTAVYNLSSTSVLVRFSEPVARISTTNATHYTLDRGAQVTGARAGDTTREVVLTTSPLEPATTYRLNVSGVLDTAATPNPVPAGTAFEFEVLVLSPTSLGTLPAPTQITPQPGGLNIEATGRGLGGTSDQTHFSYQSRSGDFDVEVRVEGLSPATLWSQTGLMARSGLGTNNPFAAVLATPAHAGSAFHWRSQTGAVATATGGFPVNYPDTWLRLSRTGNVFTGFASHDGATWQRLGNATLTLPATLQVGLVAASQSTNTPTLAALRDFSDLTPRPPTGFLPRDREPLGPSSRRTSLVISEIHYHAPEPTDGPPLEFIEIYNADSVFADLSGFHLDGTIQYTFPAGTRLPAGAFLVVAQNPAALATATGLDGIHGPWTGRLSRDAGQVQLRHRLGAVLLEVPYTDSHPWPVAADGAGHSLVLARPSYGEADPRAWSASETRGGSPGRPDPFTTDPLRPVVINEILAHTDEPLLDYVELFHPGPGEVDLSHAILTDNPDQPKYRFPAGTRLAAGSFLALNQLQLGFALSSAGESVYLLNPAATRVIDAVRFGPQFNGISSGRLPNGTGPWTLLAQRSPAAANGAAWSSPIVFSEIFYHPPQNDPTEFVELHNRSTAPVNLRGWRLDDGIQFRFEHDLLLPPGGFLAVAQNAELLRSRHPSTNPNHIVGNFSGQLANGGERIALLAPEMLTDTNAAGDPVVQQVFVTVQEVTYRDGGRWGRWSDGGGSTLERIDPRADPRLPDAWSDSDESTSSTWMAVEQTGFLELGRGDASELHVLLLGEGECLIDDVQLIDSSGANLVANGTFEGGLTDWVAQGNHVASSLSTNAFSGRRSLHLRASGGGDNGANRIKTYLHNFGPLPNTPVTFRARVRWLRGHPDLLFRLKGNYFETLAHLPIPPALGTPGRANRRPLSNAGPQIGEIRHHPILPAPFEPVTVTVPVQDPDGLHQVRLRLRYDPSVSEFTFPLRDDGQAGDAVAGDGIHTAVIPGEAAGVLLAFRVEATDRATPAATSVFPPLSHPGEYLVRFGEQQPAGSFGTYRLWMTQRHIDIWTDREVLSNEALPGTLVYSNLRAIPLSGARYRGSPFIRPNYTGPTGTLCGYIWETPKDDPLLGAEEFNLDWLEQPGRDPSFQRERLSFWIGEQLGVPYSHQRYIRVVVNGIPRGYVYTDSQQPNAEYIRSWFPNADTGQIFKIDDWFEFNDSVFMEFNVDATLEPFTDRTGQLSQTRYRWNWERKANRGLDDDYSSLLNLVETLNLPTGHTATQEIQRTLDLDGWLRPMVTRRVVSDWDGYGYRRGKNTFAYLPPEGGWHLLLWDLDFSLGGGSDNPTQEIFMADDPVMTRFFQHPLFGRTYLQGFADAIAGPLAPGAIDPLMKDLHAALLAHGVPAASPTPIRTWLDSRRTYLQSVLATNTAPWSIQVPDPSAPGPFPGATVFSGTAPLQVRFLLVNGQAYEPAWSTVTQWSLALPLSAGTNLLTFVGVDRLGLPVTNATSTLEVVRPGQDDPAESSLRITEISYNPTDPDAEYLELLNHSSRTTYNLAGWRLQGVDFNFPGGSILSPGQRLLLVKNRATFESTFGTGHPVLGEFPGRLDNAGETLRLLRPGITDDTPIVVTEVTYGNRSPWPASAHRDGTALQILDPAQDPRRPGNWIALNAQGQGHAPWQFLSATARATATSTRLQLTLATPGDVLIDDLSLVAGLVPRVGTELARNGGFEQPLEPSWSPDPGAASSTLHPQFPRSGRSSLRLITTTPGATIEQTLATPLVAGEFYTLSFWYQPQPAGSALTARLDGNGPSATVNAQELPLPAFTPGQPNTVSVSLAAFPDVWINEVLPPPATSASPAWIELFNAGTSPVNLDGWFLSDLPEQPGAWPFPPGTTLAPGAFLVIGAGQPSPLPGTSLHTDFTLPPTSGSVVLSRRQNGVAAPVDFIHYSNLSPGRAIGSFPDGPWTERRILERPTPGAPNDATALPVRIVFNEWMARNNTTIADPADGNYDDWFELFNAGSQPVDLTGYTLTDDPTDPDRFVIPPGFVLPPHAVLLVWADGEPEQTVPGQSLHANFSLSADGEFLGLYSPGGSLVDLVAFDAQDRDISEGLFPDGNTSNIVRFDRPTPGALNDPGTTPPMAFTHISLDPAGVTLTWSSQAGVLYQLQFADTPTGPWSNLGATITGTGNPVTATDPNPPTAAARYYRFTAP